jgi:hypothetical protein
LAQIFLGEGERRGAEIQQHCVTPESTLTAIATIDLYYILFDWDQWQLSKIRDSDRIVVIDSP